MKTKLTKKAVALFENIKKIDEEGREYWSSRDLWKILEYTENRHFLPVIEKAKVSCENSGHLVSDHFEDILEMVSIGSNTERQMKSIKLSRYACYLTVQNADPSKTIVAQAQTYFAIQTRIAEVKQMEEYNQLEEGSKDTRPYGKHGIGSESFSYNSDRREIKKRECKR